MQPSDRYNDDAIERQRRAEVEAREFAAMIEELCPNGGFLFGYDDFEVDDD